MDTAAAEAWRKKYDKNTMPLAKLVRYAPAAVTVEKLLRNQSVNPADRPFTDEEVSALKNMLDTYKGSLRELTQSEGKERHAGLMKRYQDGSLQEMAALAGALSETDQRFIEQHAARMVAAGTDSAVARATATKERLMKVLGCDGALTTPDGRIYLAEAGSMSSVLSTHEEYRTFLLDELFGKIVLFFVAAGAIDEVHCRQLLGSYFKR